MSMATTLMESHGGAARGLGNFIWEEMVKEIKERASPRNFLMELAASAVDQFIADVPSYLISQAVP